MTMKARLHSRCFEHEPIACAFDLLRLDGDDLRRQPLADRKATLLKLLEHSQGGRHPIRLACEERRPGNI